LYEQIYYNGKHHYLCYFSLKVSKYTNYENFIVFLTYESSAAKLYLGFWRPTHFSRPPWVSWPIWCGHHLFAFVQGRKFPSRAIQMQPPTLRHRLGNWLSSRGSIVLFLWQTLAKKANLCCGEFRAIHKN